MNARNLSTLSVVAVLILIVAFWIGHSSAPEHTAQQLLYPDLKGKLDSVTSLQVFKAGDQLSVELVRDGETWKVKQRNNYAADTNKVKALLLKLEEATLREQKTSNPANYAALAVQDLTDNATTGVRLELAGAPTPIKLIVGKRDVNARATYVRRAGETQSWQISDEIEVAADPTQWLKRDLANIGADRMQEVSTQLTGAPSYNSFKNARTDANFDVKPLPKGRELNSVSASNSVAQALVSLQLDNARPSSELVNEKVAGRAVFHTFDGLVIEFVGYIVGERRWITLHANFDSDLAKRFHVTTTAPEKKEATPDTSLDAAIKKGQEEATALNTNFDTWAFALPTYKYDAIFKPLDDLLKKVELPKKK
jgi:hypothetical protein